MSVRVEVSNDAGEYLSVNLPDSMLPYGWNAVKTTAEKVLPDYERDYVRKTVPEGWACNGVCRNDVIDVTTRYDTGKVYLVKRTAIDRGHIVLTNEKAKGRFFDCAYGCC